LSNNEIIVYESGELEVQFQLNEDTIWLAQKQIAGLFDKDIRTINDHIKAIYKEEELVENSTIRKFRIVQKEGSREVNRDVLHYNLDVIISVGYRTNSVKATKFRQWATKILKNYIFNGYSINSEKITNERFVLLEKDVNHLKEKLGSLLAADSLDIKQGIFYDGQIFDAYILINNILKKATNEVVLIDNFIDETVLTLFSKYSNLKFTIISKSIPKQLQLDIDKYNAQYKNLTVKKSSKYHDRFLIIDNTEAYHIGASLKDLGKKVFAFSKIDTKLVMESMDVK